MHTILKSKNLLFLFLILSLGFFVRIYKLDELPLYGDELTMVYDSYSLLRTGMDQLGNKFPINFSMGEGRPAGYVYTSIPFVSIFGPGVWGIRSLSVLSGLGVIILVYFLGKKIFSEKVGLIASFLAALSPWEISLSRGGFESHFALFLALLGIVFFLFSKNKPQNLLCAIISWGLAVHTYPTYRLILPLFLPAVIYYLGGFKSVYLLAGKKYILFLVFLFLFFTVTAFQQTFSSSSIDRVMRIGVFSDRKLKEELVQKINYERTISSLTGASKYFHNKPLEQSMVLVNNYFKNFSPEFLFLTGDGNPRHNMAEMGEFYWVEALFIIIGFGFSLKKGKKKILTLLIGWILISPLASAITGEPHVLRSAFMFPPLIIFSSLGLKNLFEKIKHIEIKILLGLILLVWTIQLGLYLERIYFLSPQKHGRFWSETAETASLMVLEKRKEYAVILLSDKIDNIEYSYQVYAKLSPQEVISQNQKPFEMEGVKGLKKFDNVLIGQFLDTEIFIKSLPGKILYIGDISEKYSFPEYQIVTAGDGIGGLVLREKLK